MDYDIITPVFRPRRLKIIWNWRKEEQGQLVSVLPGKTFHRTSDVSATIVGRSLFAAPPRVRLTETENAVLKALANDDCGDFFLCGVLDYEFEFGVSSKLVLDEIEATMRADNCLPGFVDKAIEQRAGEVLKRMGYVN